MCTEHSTLITHLIEEPAPMSMNREELLEELKTHSPTVPLGAVIREFAVTSYPYYDIRNRVTHFAAAAYAVIEQSGQHSITALVYYVDEQGAERFIWFCHDKYLSGSLEQAEVIKRHAEAVLGAHAAKRRQVETELAFVSTAHSRFSLKNCGFWTQRQKNRDYVCVDTSILVEELTKRNPGISMPEVLQKHYNTMVSAGSSPSLEASTGEVTFKDYAFSEPILFLGESGSGKTRTAYQYAKETDSAFVKLSCEAGTSSIDILGFYMKGPSGDMAWVDGAMTEAFRKAAAGKRTLLLIDELLRPDVREISIFLTALDPDPFTGEYVLKTGRILSVDDGLAVTETLRVSPCNLCVIATTNIGGKYNVSDMDKALADRFVNFRMDTTEAGVVEAANSVCEANGLPTDVATRCGVFWKAMVEAQKMNLVLETPTKRIINRALRHCRRASDAKRHLLSMATHWVAMDPNGFPLDAQLKAVQKILDQAFDK